MNKSAALAKKLLQAAAEHPAAAPKIMPKVARLLKHGQAVEATLHEAMDKEAGDGHKFALWAIARGKKYTPGEAQAVVDRLKVPFISQAERTPSKRGPFQVGETVSVDKYNNNNEANSDACSRYHQQFGEVEKLESDAVIVRFDDNKLIRFEGPNKPGKSLGMGRGTRPSVVTERARGRAMIEVVYISDKKAKPPGKGRIEQIREYVTKGELRGEKRHQSFYTGLCLKQAENKAGQWYCTLFSQQRMKFPMSVNPQKGTLFYIGRLGGRPGAWEAEYESLMAEAKPPEPEAPYVDPDAGKTDEEVLDGLDFGDTLM
jgi:hypothetical protein